MMEAQSVICLSCDGQILWNGIVLRCKLPDLRILSQLLCRFISLDTFPLFVFCQICHKQGCSNVMVGDQRNASLQLSICPGQKQE